MSSVIQQGLLITVIGMGLVFAVIIFLWGLMGLMMRMTSRNEALTVEPQETSEEVTPLVPKMASLEAKRRAAAAAVVVGLAMESNRGRGLHLGSPAETGGISPWQSVHRAWQLEQYHKRG